MVLRLTKGAVIHCTVCVGYDSNLNQSYFILSQISKDKYLNDTIHEPRCY